MNKKAILPIPPTVLVLIIVALVLLGFVAIVASSDSIFVPGTGNGGTTNPKQKVVCDVVIKHPVFSAPSGFKTGNVKIEQSKCEVRGTCFLAINQQTLGIGNLFKQKGFVELTAAGKSLDSSTFDIFIGSSDTFTLKGCTREKQVSIRVLDDKGNLVEDRSHTIGG